LCYESTNTDVEEPKCGQIDKGKTQADVEWMKPRAAKVAQELQEAIAAIEAQRQQDLAVLTGKLGTSAHLLYWYKSTQKYTKVPHRQARYLSSLALLVQKYTNVHKSTRKYTKVHESARTDAEGTGCGSGQHLCGQRHVSSEACG
jgi:hypothetical protein